MYDLEKVFIVSAVQKEVINFPKQSEHINKLAFELKDLLFKSSEVDKSQENKKFRLLDAIEKIEYHTKHIMDLATLIEEEGSLHKFANLYASCNQIINVELKDLKGLVT